MREQLTQYVHSLFIGSANTEDIQQEILQNTLDRYDDLINQGKTPEAAYRLAIDGIGDLSEILSTAPVPAQPDVQKQKTGAKSLRSIAIGLYICCVIPVILLSSHGLEDLGVCLMFLMIALATVLMVRSGSQDSQAEQTNTNQKKTVLYRSIQALWGFTTLGIYLGISFFTGAWHITWLVFPIMGCMRGIVRAIRDLKGGT